MTPRNLQKKNDFTNAISFVAFLFVVGGTLNSRAGDYNLTNKPLLIRATWFLRPQDTTQNQKIYTAVEVSPVFPGGDKGFIHYLSQNIRYPQLAREKNVQGRVYVQFIVERDGSLSDIKALRDPGEGLGAEAIRVISDSPKWKPGLQNNVAVRVQYTVPVNFSLVDGTKNKTDDPTRIAKGGDSPAVRPVETQPEYPGGSAAFSQLLAESIRYPKLAHDNKVEGRVYIRFVVEKDGSLSGLSAIRDPGYGLGDEAIRVIRLSPKWKPGTQNNIPVRVMYTVPVSFKL
jgi:TonB family protein